MVKATPAEATANQATTATTATEARPQKAPPSSLRKDDTVASACARLLEDCRWQIRSNEAPALVGTDPEGVHQLRVGVRRLRALLNTFSEVIASEPYEWLRTELRWLQQALGPARDADVFLHETLPPIREWVGPHISLEPIAAAAHDYQRHAYSQAHAALRGERYRTLMTRLETLPDDSFWRAEPHDPRLQPIAPFAVKQLKGRRRKLRKLGRRSAELNDQQLHELRIRGKKLRYAVEFFAPLFRRQATGRYLKEVKALQDCLGVYNDAAVGRQLVWELQQQALQPGPHQGVDSATSGQAAEGAAAGVKSAPSKGARRRRSPAQPAPEMLACAGGIVIGWQAAQAEIQLRHFTEVWQRLEQSAVFWKDKSLSVRA
ncbi:hypothetical protein CKO15_06385 [Halorhodospira abdelmalekii]|uniref:CHAD domain-containing protein n=1 Tax=Halorhodospira abdelmalekii TaxID=421629 RepID=UPI0019068175|nr:CHAD domain-containing protein [Halorhodospira abdelmalekii]MBK1734919.1 hypothetical protein [Halorhodospira abdelmalekii]